MKILFDFKSKTKVQCLEAELPFFSSIPITFDESSVNTVLYFLTLWILIKRTTKICLKKISNELLHLIYN